MPYQILANPPYEIDRGRLLKNRPLADKDICAAFESLEENPRQAARMPGIKPGDVRKLRWPLKSYRMGSSGGLRIIFLLVEDKKLIVPLAVWQKKSMTNESDVLAHIRKRLSETVSLHR